MMQFCRLLIAIFLYGASARAHKCVHDRYMASKNVTQTISPQTYLNHPFETTDSNVSRRQLSAKWQPLRIHVDTSDIAKHTFSAVGQKVLHRVTSSALPHVIKILSKHLHVIRVNGNLKIVPNCLKSTSGGTPATTNDVSCCGKNPSCHWETNTCIDVAVPESHKNIGISNADFVIYLTANEKKANNDDTTLTVGGTCKVDQHGRPLAGQLILNLASFKDSYSTNFLVTVITHEMSHALGWTHGSFSKFRDEKGNLRANAITKKKALGKTISLLSTPAITKYVRSYFGCNSLAGMELEDQGGSWTAGSHPEERIYPGSYMSGQVRGDVSSYTIDAMALSVFQDSGWYQVKNLDQAGRLAWGRGMGCRVATHKCNDLGAQGNNRGMFCSQQDQTFCAGNNKQVLGYCDLSQYSGALPSIFQYFPSQPDMGGGVEIADFCPRSSEYSNGDCTDTSNTDALRAHSGNQLGSDARCFVSSLAVNSYAPSYHKPRGPEAECYRRTCKPNSLEIQVGSQTVSCPVSNTATGVSVSGYDGYIVCPPYTGPKDIRCTPTCSIDDPDCLGIKGSAADSIGSAVPPEPKKKITAKDIFDVFHNLISGDQPVVVHGRKLLRH